MCGTSQLLGIRDYELGTGNMREDSGAFTRLCSAKFTVKWLETTSSPWILV